MQAGLSAFLVARGVGLHASLQQEIDDVGSAELAGPSESGLHLSLRGRWLQTAVVVEEILDHVETTDSEPPFQVQSRAASRQELGCLAAPVVQAAIDCTRSVGAIDQGAMVDQQFQQREL